MWNWPNHPKFVTYRSLKNANDDEHLLLFYPVIVLVDNENIISHFCA